MNCAVCITDCTLNSDTGSIQVGWRASTTDGAASNGFVDVNLNLSAIQINNQIVNAAKARLSLDFGTVFQALDKVAIFGGVSLI